MVEMRKWPRGCSEWRHAPLRSKATGALGLLLSTGPQAQSSSLLIIQWWSVATSSWLPDAYLQWRQRDPFLLLECLVFRDLSSLCVLTNKLLFFRHRMSHSVPVHPPWPYPDVLHHGCHAEHGQVQLLRWQVRDTISGVGGVGWGQKPWQPRSLIVAGPGGYLQD